MRIRTFIAESMETAIKDIRKTLGPDAIIISTYESPRGRGVEVRAAVEDTNIPVEGSPQAEVPHLSFDDDLERRLRKELLGEMQTEMSTRGPSAEVPTATEPSQPDAAEMDGFDFEVRPDGWVKTGITGLLKNPLAARKTKGQNKISQTEQKSEDQTAGLHNLIEDQAWADHELEEPLAFHNIPETLRSNLLHAASAMDADTATLALGAALDARITIDPIAAIPARPLMTVGAPGSGKTVTTAKLAAQAVLAGAEVCMVTTDSLRAGGLAQLQTFAEILQVKLLTAETPDRLAEIIADHPTHAIFIDTPATNPYVRSELSDLFNFIQAGDIEPVLVAPASGDVEDFADVAKIFASLGVRRMITTRVDAARRLGGLIVAADTANLALAQISITPYLAEGLSTINPLSLARLLVEVPSAKANVDPKLSHPSPSNLSKTSKSKTGKPKEAAR